MNPVRIIILIVAAAAAIGAAFMVSRMVNTPGPVQTTQEVVVETVEISQASVLTAARDLRVGELIAPGDLRWKLWPENNILPAMISQDAAPEAINDLTGATVRLPMFQDEPVNRLRFIQRGEQGLMAALINPGMRAMAIEISTETGSGGFVLPEDRVDIILTYDEMIQLDGETTTRITARTVVKNVRVLAIDQFIATGEGGTQSRIGNTATVEVTPDEAELLNAAERAGRLSVTLRPIDSIGPDEPRDPRMELLGRGASDGAVTIIRNGRPSLVGVGG
jgi:pilus assembly protein CpaB